MKRLADFLQRLRGDAREDDRQRWFAILSVNRLLAAADDRQKALTVLVDEAVRTFGAERGFLVVRRNGEPRYAVEVARSLDREPIASPEKKLSSTVLERTFASEGVFSEDAQEGPLGASQSIADLRLRSVLSVPLRAAGEVFGALYLDHRFQAGAFAERDLPWLLAFADQGALALRLHRLLAEQQQQQARLAAQNRELVQTVATQAEVLAADAAELQRHELAQPFAGLLGEAPAFVRALRVLDRVAGSDLPVLLTGESGTGKSAAARALHLASARRRGEFVAVNVAAIPASLLESELFGHVRGAFTGADKDRLGLLRQASGGTLFLDEITEMGLELQARLLRALEERLVRPVGGDREIGIDVRVVAATNREPQQAIADGRLREDLYFRLAVVTVRLPALRERSADVPLLAEHFVAAAAKASGRPVPRLGAELLAALRARAWPGNLRQLDNELQRLLALAGDGALRADQLSPERAAPADIAGLPGLDMASVERWAIARALAAASGNKAEAARLLGISRGTLYGKLGDG
jgi:DNA-binding NtrC family response regulator